MRQLHRYTGVDKNITADLIIAYVVVTFVHTPPIWSVSQCISDILDVRHAVNDSACRPVCISVRHGIIIDCGSAVRHDLRVPTLSGCKEHKSGETYLS